MVTSGVLLLADSRLPAGGHAHSGGVEMAVLDGAIATAADLERFLRGRLRTAGVVSGAFAAAATLLAAGAQPDSDRTSTPRWPVWDRAFCARTPAPALRAASRAQGAALLRTVTRMWSSAALVALADLGRPHHPLVLGAAVTAGGGTAADAAGLAFHHLVGGACSAAVRLLGLDPLRVAEVAAATGELAETLIDPAVDAARAAVATEDPAVLPARGGPFPEVLAARHARAEGTLFAS